MNFTKMHGLGNDFIIVEPKIPINYPELAIKLCDRHFGIGADGLILVDPPDFSSNCDINWRIFNSDGTEPQMCGNGIRCFARYVYEKGLVKNKKFSVGTLAGEITPEILDNGQVRVDMGQPMPDLIDYPVEIEGKALNITTVSMGNPHCIVFTGEETGKLAKTLGPVLEIHRLFPEKTNVEFVKVLSGDKIRVDVWERGCGITLACGTGACASVVAAVLNGLVKNSVKVELPGGELLIEWDRPTDRVFMTGSAEFVFEGDFFEVKNECKSA